MPSEGGTPGLQRVQVVCEFEGGGGGEEEEVLPQDIDTPQDIGEEEPPQDEGADDGRAVHGHAVPTHELKKIQKKKIFPGK